MAYLKIQRHDLDLKECIGSGGFSTVYRALWNQKEVAAKRSTRPQEREKDRHEADIISRLNHPNIVKVFGVVEDHLDFFLVLEICDGGTLRSYLNAHKGIPLGQLFYDWAEQAGSPLEYLRENKIIHKDVKSPNYLITKDNILKLGDFGLAKNTDITISRASGTASYPWMAPELLRDDILSPNYDIYAYGVVVWELWTTDVPFADCTVLVNLIWRICEQGERPHIPADCPRPIVMMLTQCWDVDWKKRPSLGYILKTLKAMKFIASPWKLVNSISHSEPHLVGVAVSPNGDIAVADRGNQCACVYSDAGGMKAVFDTNIGLESGLGESHPWNIVIGPGDLFFVTDCSRFVKSYNSTGVWKGKWPAISPNNCPSHKDMTELQGLNIDSDGQILVGQVKNSYYISQHREDGSHVRSISVSIAPHHLSSTSEKFTVISSFIRKVVKVVDYEGQVLHTLNADKTMLFWNPRGVCCQNNIVFLCNSHNECHEISCFSLAGVYLGKIAVANRPRCVTFSQDECRMYISHASGVDVYARK